MNRKAELEFRLRIERKNYKVAARKYRSSLRQDCYAMASEHLHIMLATEQRIEYIMDRVEEPEKEN